MADPEDTIYEIDPHSKAKHRILGEYLKRFFIILSRGASRLQAKRLLYIDGFAGAGEHLGGDPGSPLIAIRTAVSQSTNLTIPLVVKMVEARKDRYEHLCQTVKAEAAEFGLPASVVIDPPIHGECEEEIDLIIDEHDRRCQSLGPGFFFLDQFGYAGFSMSFVKRILSHASCEVFSFMNWQRLQPYMTDPTKWPAFTKAFGDESWRNVVSLTGHEKERCFRDTYLAALKRNGGAKYSYPVRYEGHQGQRDLLVVLLDQSPIRP